MVRKGLGRGKGKGYKNLAGRDPKVHSDSAKGRKQPQFITHIPKPNPVPIALKETREMAEKQTLTEREILLLKRRLNDGKINPDDIFQIRSSFKLTDEQEKKGLKFLKNEWENKTGGERKNNPFGQREIHVLENFDNFKLIDFYDTSTFYQTQLGIKFYVPIYRVIGKDGSSFLYWWGYQERNQKSPVNIIG